MRKTNAIIELFENEKFQKTAPFFFEKLVTETEVCNATGISRPTMDKFASFIDRYYPECRIIRTVGNRRAEKPYCFKIELLSFYFEKALNLYSNELGILQKLISDPAIKNVLVKRNPSLDLLVSKTILVVLFIDVLSKNLNKDTQDVDTIINMFYDYNLFGFLMRELPKTGITGKKWFEKDYPKQLYHPEDFVFVNALPENALTVRNVFDVETDELRQLGKALINFATTYKDDFNYLCRKFRNSTFQIQLYPMEWHNFLSAVIGPLTYGAAERRKTEKKYVGAVYYSADANGRIRKVGSKKFKNPL